MEKSKVYFTDFRTQLGVSLTEKLQKLIKKAGIESIDMSIYEPRLSSESFRAGRGFRYVKKIFQNF